MFGATMLHRRIPFKDPAILSRSIVITTRYKAETTPYRPEEFKPFAEVLRAQAEEIDWSAVAERGGDRIGDTWAPLLQVDATLGGVCEPYAAGQMEKARTDLSRGHEEESSQAVFRTLLALALPDNNQELMERVLLADVASLDGNGLNSWQAGQLLRDMRFETKTVGGKQYVYTGGAGNLVAVGRELGIEDEWFRHGAGSGVAGRTGGGMKL